MSRGRFITFEGIEGSGKSTQSRLLAEHLRDAGLTVDLTREPGGTDLGEAIRKLLLAENGAHADPHTQALLHTAARAEHVAKRIRPQLDSGAHVLCDRFYDSTLAYQGGGLGLPVAELLVLQHFATQGCEPDVRILLVLDPETGLTQRLRNRSDRNWIDDAGGDFHRRVQAVFQQRASDDPSQWLVVDAELEVGAIAEIIVADLRTRFAEFSSL